MTDHNVTPWQGDWKLRLQSRLESLGFETLEEFLSAHGGKGYVAVAESLGDTNVAAMQLYSEHIRQAVTQGRLREVAADCLSRFLVEHIKRGWGCGRHFPFRMASAFGDWKAAIRQFAESESVNDRLDRVTEAIKESRPPEGWIPESGTDPIIQSAFARVWPAEH